VGTHTHTHTLCSRGLLFPNRGDVNVLLLLWRSSPHKKRFMIPPHWRGNGLTPLHLRLPLLNTAFVSVLPPKKQKTKTSVGYWLFLKTVAHGRFSIGGDSSVNAMSQHFLRGERALLKTCPLVCFTT